MQKLLEFYEMISLNDANLRDSEKLAILKARRALRLFQQAMESFKTDAAADPSTQEPTIGLVA